MASFKSPEGVNHCAPLCYIVADTVVFLIHHLFPPAGHNSLKASFLICILLSFCLQSKQGVLDVNHV